MDLILPCAASDIVRDQSLQMLATRTLARQAQRSFS
jgi:hypothetical protein